MYDVPMVIDESDLLHDTTPDGIIRPTSRVPLPTRVAAVVARQVADDLGLLTANDVCFQAGISYRMLDYWTTRGKVTPAVPASGSGSGRLYWPEVVEEIRDIRRRLEACPFHPHQGRRA